MTEDRRDWRLKAELDTQAHRATLERLVGRARSSDVADDVGEAVSDDVLITHDGRLLFAYAETRDALESARRAIESVLSRDGVQATVAVSHWDDQTDEWLQVDPPPTEEAARAAQVAQRDAEAVETRTMVVSAGKLVRAEVEQTMRRSAHELGLRCEVIEHPHLLTTQVAFTVTGPNRKIDEFAETLRAEELATMRTERAVMMSPL